MRVTLAVTGIAAGGDGVGRLDDGRVCFVPRTAPGDLVEAELAPGRRRFARGRVLRVLEPSPDRVVPPCPHYERDECGGCQLMHLRDDAQRAARARIAGDALRRIGHLDLADPPLMPAPRQLGYRTKLTLHRSTDGRRIGYHRAGRAGQVFALEQCLLADLSLQTLWTAVRRAVGHLPRDLGTLVLRLDGAGGRHLVAATTRGEAWTAAPALQRALQAEGVAAQLWWQPPHGAARVMAGGSGEAYPATVFEQVHPAMGRAARAHALAALGDVQGRHVWDLYAGIGDTTAALLDGGATVESVELDARAVAWAERQRPDDGARAMRLAGTVESRIGSLRPAAAAVTNPPRTGMDAAAVRVLAERGPARVVYISCDPATLARDVALMAGAYAVRDVTAFDLFPQTAHVECVAVLERT
jgi:23S rRNA (uracil1939-C5)-methyltransferase